MVIVWSIILAYKQILFTRYSSGKLENIELRLFSEKDEGIKFAYNLIGFVSIVLLVITARNLTGLILVYHLISTSVFI